MKSCKKIKLNGGTGYVKNLLYLIFVFVFLIFSGNRNAYAEGSIDLNRNEGAGYYRLYLEYVSGAPFQVTSLDFVPTTNKLFVYAEIGEDLLLASSALNTVSGLFGSIRYTKPDGTTIVVLSAPGAVSGTTGFIANRAQEKQGPLGLYNGGVGGYTPFSVPVDQTGIWTVEFISQDPGTVNGTAGGPLLTTANWPANQRRGIAAWDVSILQSGSLVSGRLYARWLPITPGGLTSAGNWVCSTTEMFVRTRDGILYRWQQNAFAGYGQSRLCNNSGILDLSFQRTFESIRFQPTSPVNRRFHNPDSPDNDSLYTSKMFFNTPNTSMPATAQLGAEPNHWLNPVFDNTPPTFFYTGQAAVNPMDGYFTIQYPTLQKASIVIDCSADNIYGNGNDRLINFYTSTTATTNVSWDGLDGTGAVMTDGCYLAQLLLQNGEVHFPLLDIENNFEGMVLERLNGPGTLPDYTIHWNDVALNDLTDVPLGSYLQSTSINGISSQVNGHRWASVTRGAATQTHSTQYGDSRFMDTWSYALSTATSVIYLACGILPVKLTQLTATSENEGNHIRWRSDMTQGKVRFEIEKSEDGRNFKRIGQVDGMNGNQSGYRFLDTGNTSLINYYRLKIIQPGADFQYSPIIRLDAGDQKNETFNVYPNPANGKINIQVKRNEQSTITIEITDVAGKLVLRKKERAYKGLNV
ncbi:MAG: T9SS type A sorting domain-containing protein, partial [Chitinophagaceae bacterium]|nr:T9SS type A sorting domain-containing protein [Chitinophagaceae bacterium]